MDSESKKLAEDTFLRPIADIRQSNSTDKYVEKERLKTELQVLRLSKESQDMVMDTLQHIYGNNFRLQDISKYRDKGGKIKSGYWEDRGTLQVQSVTNNSSGKNSELGPEDVMRRFAKLKLESYGFAAKHAEEALEHCGGEVDKAIELLYSKYMNYTFKTINGQDDEFSFTENDLKEIKEDEKLVLESIYDKLFEEKEKCRVWSLKFDLQYLLLYSSLRKNEVKKPTVAKEQPKKVKRKPICRNILAGNCRFGDSCRFSHDIERFKPPEIDNSTKHLSVDTGIFYLEIRFPTNGRYPYDPPIILLKGTANDIPGEVMLRVARKLFKEALECCEGGMPSIYTIAEMLKVENDIVEFIKEDTEGFPNSQKSLFDSEGLIDDKNPSKLLELPSHYTLTSSGNAARKKTSEEMLKEDKRLVDKFIGKRQQPAYRKMLQLRQSLPAWDSLLSILDTVDKFPVVVISGETGCGKSTQVPQFLLDNWLFTAYKSKEIKHCEIVCTQPRRLSALGVAERVAEERVEAVGGTVGYQIRLENKISSATRLIFCTTGILLQRLQSDPLLESVSYVIVDEVHERSEESDFLLMILKRILQKRTDLKLILMSATMNATVFSEYFGKCPILEIPGRTYPVEQLFLEDAIQKSRFVLEPDSQYCRRIGKKEQDNLLEELEYSDVQASYEYPPDSIKDENLNLAAIYGRYSDFTRATCKTIYLMDPMKINPELIESVLRYIVYGDHKWPQDGSILIFLPGLGEIQTVFEALTDSKMFGPRSNQFILIPLHSTLTSEEQARVFQKAPEGKRKIILSTNIAETSVTINDCVFVVDAGLMKEKRYDANKNMESLDLVWESRANALQRKGRAGRVMPGVCIHLFTSNRFYNHLLSQPVPEIHRVPLEQLLLRIKTLPNFRDDGHLNVINEIVEPPKDENVLSAIRRLKDIGAFNQDGNLTALGHHLATLPVDVRIGKLLLFGAMFQCVDSILTIAACLSYKSPFVSPFSKRSEADRKKKSFALCSSDHLTVLNAYKKWLEVFKKSRYSAKCYADENFLSWQTLETIVELKYQYLELLASIGFIPVDLPSKKYRNIDKIADYTGHEFNANGGNNQLLVSLLCAALYPNVVKVLTPQKSYTHTMGGAMPKQIVPSDLRFKTREDGYVSIHPSSVNSNCGNFQSPFLVYQEKVKTSKIFIRDCTMVPLFPMVFFSGGDMKIELHSGDFIVLLDEGWIILKAQDHETAEMVNCLHQALIKLLEEKIRDPLLNLLHHKNGKKIIATILFLISREW